MAAADLEHITIDGLDVNDYVTRYIADDPPFTFTPARKKMSWASSALSDGEVLIGDEDHYTNAEMVFTVGTYPSSDKDTALGVLDELTQKLQEARRNPGGIPLVWTPATSSQSLTFYILEAEYDDLLASREKGWFDNAFSGVVHLYLRPFGYASERQTLLGYTDAMTRDSWTGGPWRFDAPIPGAGVTWTINLVTTSTVNKRLYLPFTTLNSVTAMNVRTSATLSGMEVGPIFKRLSSAAYLRASLTSTAFKIATAAGTLATTAFVPTASTFYWIAVSVAGDDIQADVYGDAENPLTTPNPTSLASVSYTLTGSETGGPYGGTIRGNPGMFLTPNAATLGDVQVRRFVLRGMEDIQGSEPLLRFEIPDVQGHVPAEARQVVTEGSSQTRSHYEWGLECRDYDPDVHNPLLIDSDQLIVSGFTGQQVNLTSSGAYDPNTATTNSAIQATNLSTTNSLTIFSTPFAAGPTPNSVQTHVGTYKVRARVAGDSGVKCRWAWQIGEGPLQRNDYANLPNTARIPTSTTPTAWYELDLGTMTIPRQILGGQAWIGRFEAYSPTTAAGTVVIDYIELIPMERYGVLRAPPQPVIPSTFSVLDEFVQGSDSNLTGRTATVGGVWTAVTGTPAIDPRDFTVNSAASRVQRAVASDASLTQGRMVTAGTTAYGAVQVQADISTDWNGAIPNAGDIIRQGIFARLLDVNNWFAIALGPAYAGGGVYWGEILRLMVIKRVAGGAVNVLGFKDLGVHGWGKTRTLQLQVDAQGGWAAYSWPGGTPQPRAPLLSGVDPDLVTPLTTGKVGLWDAYAAAFGSNVVTRRYDNFQAFVAPQDAVLYASKHLEVRSSLIEREGTVAGRYGNVPQPRGSNFFVPAAGANGHVSRMAVKARRTDVDSTLPDVSVSNSMTIAVFTTPRYLTPTAP